MTCCLSISIRNCSFAAADTRIGIEHDGVRTNHDGPHPFTLEVGGTGRVLAFPYCYRKIRKVSDGWVVCAGEYSIATKLLDLLKRQDAILFSQARSLLARNAHLLNDISATTGIAREKLLNTLIIAAPRGTSATGWVLSLRPNDGRTYRTVKDFAINWPLDVPTHERLAAEATLRQALSSAHAGTTPLTYAKAMGRIISTATRYASDVGPYIQFGATLPVEGGGSRSLYFDGLTDDLLALTEEEFDGRCQLAI